MRKKAAACALALAFAAQAAAASAPKTVQLGLFGLTVWGDFPRAVGMAREGGFQTAVIAPYAEHLDVLREAGMKGIVGLWLDPETARDRVKWEAFRARVRKSVSELKDHPALFAWYLADEPDGEGVPVEKIAEARGLIRSLDKKTPLLAVFNKPSKWAPYFPYFDIICVDPYLRRKFAGGYEDPEVVTAWLTKAKDDMRRAKMIKPLWAVLGAFEERPKQAGAAPGYRKPTPEEFGRMAEMARREGAEGILVYTFAFAESAASRGWRLANDDPPLWRAVRELGEMRNGDK